MEIPHNETVYIVSGFMRTGTSMMMKALEAGGMTVFKNEKREEFRKKHADEFYDPNEGGLYEIDMKDVTEDFPEKYKGKLIKFLMGGLQHLNAMPKIKVIFMRRDTEEIRQSYQAFFGEPFKLNDEKFKKSVERCIANLKNRRDVDITVFEYTDVVKNPVKAFEELKNNGWPVDTQKCAEVVNPSLYRFRKENLIPGIK